MLRVECSDNDVSLEGWHRAGELGGEERAHQAEATTQMGKPEDLPDLH